MINKPWQEEALSLHKEGFSNRAIGRKLDKDESVIRRYLKKVAELASLPLGNPLQALDWSNIKPSNAQQKMFDEEVDIKVYGGGSIPKASPMNIKPLRIEDNSRILIISDMHIPYHHKDTIIFLQYLKDKYNPTRVICLGDEVDHLALSYHEKETDAPSAVDELRMALPVIKQLEEMFPEMDILDSNHGSLAYRKAKTAGIPKHYLKSYADVLQVGDGWKWHYDMVVDLPNGQKCYFHHGKSANVTKTSQTMSMCAVQGHFHETFKIEYWANPIALYWAMQTGCLIDDKSYAFNYNNVNLKRPIIGTGLIIDSQPILEPMVLSSDGRWIYR